MASAVHPASGVVAVPSENLPRAKRIQTLIFPSADAVRRPPPIVAIAERPSERPTRPALVPADDSVIELSVSDLEAVDAAPASVTRTTRERPRWLGLAVNAALAGVALFGVVVVLDDGRAAAAPSRSPRLAWPERTAIGEPAIAPAPPPPRGGCVASGPPRIVARRGELKPGLDVVSSGTGFVVSLAATANEAWAVRLEGSRLRAAENVRVRSAAPIRHVIARDAESLDVRIDTDGGRTIVRDGGAPPLRLVPAAGTVVARAGDDGGAVVAVKRGSTLEVGVVHGPLSTAGPLATITSAGATLGTPFVAARAGGGVVAWAQRAEGSRDWRIVVATFGGPKTAIETRALGHGISPSVAVLPDGGLLVAYAEGPPAHHRVVVRRLLGDLAPVGEPLVVSPDAVNAGQPVIDVDPDGRALVAWYAVAQGEPPSVHATPLVCDVSTYRD